jgi:hypothetical protein
MSEQPEALRLFTHELLDYEGKPNGVHVGCNNLAVCKQSYVEGETSTAIYEWADAAELRRLHAEVEALKLENNNLRWLSMRMTPGKAEEVKP